MTTQTVRGQLATYEVTLTGPTTATIRALETVKANNIPHAVSIVAVEYMPERTADEAIDQRERPAYLSSNWQRERIRRTDTTHPAETTDNARRKILDDITHAVLPLFEQPETVKAGLIAAVDNAAGLFTRRAAKLRHEANELQAQASALDALASEQYDRRDTIDTELDPATIDPAAIVAAYRAEIHDYERDRERQQVTSAAGFNIHNDEHTETIRPALSAWEAIRAR